MERESVVRVCEERGRAREERGGRGAKNDAARRDAERLPSMGGRLHVVSEEGAEAAQKEAAPRDSAAETNR